MPLREATCWRSADAATARWDRGVALRHGGKGQGAPRGFAWGGVQLGGGRNGAPAGGRGRRAPPRHHAPSEARPVVRARRDGVLAPLRGAIHDGRPHRIHPGAPPAERAWVACCAGRSCRAPVMDRDAEGGARIAAPASRRPHRGARRASYRGDRDVAGPTHTEPGRAGKGGNIRKAPHHTREVDPDVAIGFCVIRDRTISTQRRSLEVPQDDAGPLRSTRCPNVTTSSVTPPATTPSSASSAGLATTASGPAVCAQPSITTSTA